MLKVLDTATETEESIEGPTLDELAREGARRMLVTALAVEVAQYVDTHEDARDEAGHRLVVRNGQAQARTVTCGAGTLEIRAPRVNDKRVDAAGRRERFTSRILPPSMRRSPKVAEVLPILYCQHRRRLSADHRSKMSPVHRVVTSSFHLLFSSLMMRCGNVGISRRARDFHTAVDTVLWCP